MKVAHVGIAKHTGVDDHIVYVEIWYRRQLGNEGLDKVS